MKWLQGGVKSFSAVRSRIADIGTLPTDTDAIRLQKTLLARVGFGGILALICWGSFYLFGGAPLVAVFFFLWAAVEIASLLYLAIRRQGTRWLFPAQILRGLFGPFAATLLMGGMLKSSGDMLWGLMAPLGALIYSRRGAWVTFGSYVIMLSVATAIPSHLLPENGLTPRFMTTLLGLNIGMVSLFWFGALRYFVRQLNEEQARSEALLLNILPAEIAAILKRGHRTIADRSDNVSILFADAVGFTPMSDNMSPEDLVRLLNEVFSCFDTLVEKYGLQKIKTIGDCYMVAAGVPIPRDDHARALVKLALEMQESVRVSEFSGKKLKFRIGINSGPVVAGVIGHKKFSYDLWGDAVNTASRMESHGEEDTIQITETTYNLVKQYFTCESRGVINVKGKGEMKVWLIRR